MKSIALLLFIIFIFFRTHIAVASCGSATCPLNTFHSITTGELRAAYTYEYINQNQLFLGSAKSFAGAIPEDHDELQTINKLSRLSFDYGLMNDVGLSVSIPYIQRNHSHIHHHPTEDELESWNISGIGDMVVKSQIALLQPVSEFDVSLIATVGLKLPTGNLHQTNDAGEEAEIPIQPGSGSFDELIGINSQLNIATVKNLSGNYSMLPLTGGISYQINGKGTEDWRFGNTFLIHVGTEYQLLDNFSLLFQANARIQDYADVGSTGEPRGNTGGTWMYASPGISLTLNEALAAYSYVQFPVYQNVHGLQQTAKFNVQLGVSFNTNFIEN